MILVGIAGIVTIVNIILISVFRRTRELGTLRAIGASDAYIISMLGLEILILSLAGGLVGILFGMGIMQYINRLMWLIPHPFIAALMGSPVLHVAFYSQLALKAVFLSVLIGLLSAVFPTLKAIRINPMEAVRLG
jgi:ABC-type antimicrobial peptide transport system permease subunit